VVLASTRCALPVALSPTTLSYSVLMPQHRFKPVLDPDLPSRLRIPTKSLSLSSETSAIQRDEPLVLRLPTEILFEIFDLLTPRGKILMGPDDFTNILAVRSTCRAFRAISSTLKFWYDEYFCVSNLVPKRYDSSGKFEALDHDTRALRLLECFKADRVLMETMGRKIAWSFSTLSLLIAASQFIPSFRLRIISLYYEPYSTDIVSTASYPQSSINIGLEHLAFCPNMTALNISNERGYLSLDHVVKCCPSLKKLELSCNGAYIGSLRGLGNLQELNVWDYTLDDETLPRQNLLPIDSAFSLTRLELIYINGPLNNVYHSEHMRAFTNLSTYSILPLCDKICDTLIHTQFTHLRTFVASARVQSISVNNILGILASRSLSSLQTLRLLIEPFSSEFNASYFDIIKAITSRLSSTLEELQLTMGINTAWCRHFSSLHKLRRFIWMAADLECCESNDSSALPLETGYDLIMEDDCLEMVETVTEKMIETFHGFEKLPSIHIFVLDETEYSEWDNDNIMAFHRQ
jgi:F-box domain